MTAERGGVTLTDFVGVYERAGGVDAFGTFCECSNEKSVIASHLRERLDRNDSVLDIGAGRGDVTIPVAETVNRVVAVDPSADSLDVLTKRADERGLENVTTVLGEWPRVDVDGPFDKVLCSHTFHLFDDARRALGRIADVATDEVYVVTNDSVNEHIQLTEYSGGGFPLASLVSRYAENRTTSECYTETAERCRDLCREVGLAYLDEQRLDTRITATKAEFVNICTVLFELMDGELKGGLELEFERFFDDRIGGDEAILDATNVLTVFVPLPSHEDALESLRGHVGGDEVDCPSCDESAIRRNGRTAKGAQEYFCRTCGTYFNDLTGTPFHDVGLSIPEMAHVVGSDAQTSASELAEQLGRPEAVVADLLAGIE